jgi:hypothetical protein
MDLILAIINLPSESFLKSWMPIVIAIIALIATLFSMYFTRKEFRISHRPFVWANSYAFLDQSKSTIIPVREMIGFRVKNSPAKIIRQKILINFDTKNLFSSDEKNFVRFPDEKSEWTFTIAKEKFDEIMDQCGENTEKLIRIVSTQYTSLNGGKVYHHRLEQNFNLADNNWKDITTEAN